MYVSEYTIDYLRVYVPLARCFSKPLVYVLPGGSSYDTISIVNTAYILHGRICSLFVTTFTIVKPYN